MRTNYVITIARNFGAGGKSVGLALSKELGIPCYERQILTMASEKSGIDEKLFVDMDERLNGGFLAKNWHPCHSPQCWNQEKKTLLPTITCLTFRQIFFRPWHEANPLSSSENVQISCCDHMEMSSTSLSKHRRAPAFIRSWSGQTYRNSVRCRCTKRQINTAVSIITITPTAVSGEIR